MAAVAAVRMPDLLTLHASSQPGKPAVIDDRPGENVVSWTYAQLDAEANRLANALASLGVGPGEKVIWCGPDSPQVVAVINATRRLGAVAVPLNYRLTAVEARYIVIHSDACAAYVDAEYAHLIPAPHDGHAGNLSHVLVYGGAAPAGMGAGLTLGQTIIIQRKFVPEDWLRLVDKYEVSSTFSAPPLIRLVCGLPTGVKARYDRSSMRIMLANAAPWSFALKRAYLTDFPADSLWEVYGSTELGVNCVLEPKDQLHKPGSCGQPAPGVEIRLLDADGNEVTGTGPAHPRRALRQVRRGLQRVLQAAGELSGRHAR
jgi:acyl-CoA synthetase (AMP-forming)/AMP-acid ligase II